MLVQIYTAQSADEALALARVGVDRVGLTVSGIGLPGEIDPATGREIVTALRGRAASSALTVSTEPTEIVELARSLRPDVLHLCGELEALPPDTVAALRRRLHDNLPDLQLMQAIPVTGPSAVEQAIAYAPVADHLLLDSVTDDVQGIGAAGTVHDWSISAEVVARVDVPVILAGGLSPDNVADAIRAVRPAGVDSLTLTNEPVAGGGFRKDLDAVERFVRCARATVATT